MFCTVAMKRIRCPQTSGWRHIHAVSWLIQYIDTVVTSQIGNGFGTVKQVQRPAGKWKRASPWSKHTECSWSMVALTVDTVDRQPAGDTAPQIIQAAWVVYLCSLFQHLGDLIFPNGTTLAPHWFFFLPGPSATLLMPSLLQEGLDTRNVSPVAHFLDMPRAWELFVHWPQPQSLSLWSFAKFLNWPCSAVLWSVQLLPPHFSLPVNIPFVFSQLQSCRVTVTV